ncbi:unnamed protein product [Urochloa humidicola]
METTVSDPVTESLLGNCVHEDKSKRYEPPTRSAFWDGTRQECLRWAHLLSTIIAQSVRKIVNVLSEFGSLIARLFGCSSAPKSSQNGQTVPLNLSPLQVERLRLLRQRLDVPYDCSSVKHQDALKELWRLAYPNRQLPPLKSDLWKEMGWQNSDPSTDFRLLVMMFHDKLSCIMLTPLQPNMICILNLQGRWVHVLGESNILCQKLPRFLS